MFTKPDNQTELPFGFTSFIQPDIVLMLADFMLVLFCPNQSVASDIQYLPHQCHF